MIKRSLCYLLALTLIFALTSCGDEEDTYSFYDAASQKEASEEASSDAQSLNDEISSVGSIDDISGTSATVSAEQLEVSATQLQKDKYDIEDVANEAMEAVLKGDVNALKAAQPKLYDAFLDNEFVATMLTSISSSFKEEYGEDAEFSLEISEIHAGTTADVADMQELVNSFECDLTVETVRAVVFEIEIEGSLSSEASEEEMLVFLAEDTWYLAVFADMDMSAFQDFDPSMLEDMLGDIPDDVLNDMMENMPR